MAGSYTVKVDWNGDGDFLDTGETVTSRVRARSGDTINCAIGRDTARNLSPGAVGSASFKLDNRSRDYSPDNGSSPLAGLVGPGRKVQIAGSSSSASGNLFTGYIDDFTIDPSRTNKLVELTCVDALGAFLSGNVVSNVVRTGYRTGQAIADVLASAGYSGPVSIDSGATVLPFWWLDGVDALTAIQDLVKAEGPPAIVYIDEDGNFIFRDRHHRYLSSRSTSSQATFRDSGSVEPKHSDPFGYDAGFKDIVNSVAFDVPTYHLADPDVVWTSPGKTVVPASTVVTLLASTDSPMYSDNGVGVGWTYSGTSPTFTNFTALGGSLFQLQFTGGASSSVIWDIQMTGQSVVQGDSVQVTSSDATSITRYGTRSWDETSLPWANEFDAQALPDQIVSMRKDRNPAVSITVRSGGRDNSYDTRLNQSLTRKISDRVTIVETETGVNRDAFIERKEHTISWGARTHETVYTCDTSDTAAAGTLLRFDTAGRGFNQGVFGR